MRKAFTLVELLIVIGIIAILAGVLTVAFGGASESARAARCLANLRNLATGCQTYGMRNEHFPLAASIEYSYVDDYNGVASAQLVYSEKKGWISSYTKGLYTEDHDDGKFFSKSQTGGGTRPDTFADEEISLYCLTNGALFGSVGHDRDIYQCPSHVRAARDARIKITPRWSYAMSGYFCGNVNYDSTLTVSSHYCGVNYRKITKADRRVLFTELPFHSQKGVKYDVSKDKNIKSEMQQEVYTDAAVQYNGIKDAKAVEKLYFNHPSGGKLCAHVAFADGHVEKLLQPGKGEVEEGEARDLLSWLCTGTDFSFSGTEYKEIK